jgi:hypothetical protein
VKQIPVVNLLTISRDGALDNFLMPLIQRDEYRSLTANYTKLIDDMEKVKTFFRSEIAADRSGRFPGAHGYRCFELKTLPIQLLIAGLKPEQGKSDKRYGCLVFMVGSDSLSGTETGKESGFYTELEPMVNVMKNLAWSLMKNAPLLHDENGGSSVAQIRRAG